MFGWLTTLLSLLLFPFMLLFFHWPTRIMSLRNVLPRQVRDNHWYAGTVYIEAVARPWWSRKMRAWGVAAQTFACFVFHEESCWASAQDSTELIADDKRREAQAAFDRISRHESIHILQQAMFSPILVVLAWGLDTLLFKAYQRYFPSGQWKYVAIWEVVAYRLDDDELDQ